MLYEGESRMRKIAAALSLAIPLSGNPALALDQTISGIPPLNHVFVIVMENHGYGQIFNNPNAPYINSLAASANYATNYFGIGHPSLTNYLEIVGGSNFGVLSDDYPDWHNTACAPNLATRVPQTDNPPIPPPALICPIAGTGKDAPTVAIDTTNETQGLPGLNNIDGVLSIAANPNTIGKTIADQLVVKGLIWKSYQESLPPAGADKVNYSDGVYTNSTDFTKILPALTPPLTGASVVAAYAVKHNPFAYFKSVQEGQGPLSLNQTVDFDGPGGLYADLGSGNAANFSFIAPNQCNDQHGRGNAGAFCNYDPSSNGTQADLNPALIYRGDVTVKKLVTAIQNSPVWTRGRTAIIVVWDENDYSTAPNTNKVLLIVSTNYGVSKVISNTYYNHFSLLKTLEAGFGLPCLNHACDSSVAVMSDLFAPSPSGPPPALGPLPPPR
jgi:hypothetical protein